jgi:hypothetical protein
MAYLIAFVLMFIDAKITDRDPTDQPTWISDRLWDLALYVTRRKYHGLNMELVEELYWRFTPWTDKEG